MGRQTPSQTTRVAFMCVQNAGRSRIAAGFVRRECERRNLTEKIEVHSAGTHPVDYLVRMGCYTAKFNPALYSVDSREWTVADPNTDELQHVRTIRDDIEQRVIVLFDGIAADLK